MKQHGLFLRKVFLVVYLLAIHLFAGLFIYEKLLKEYLVQDTAQVESIKDPTEKAEVPTPLPIPSIFAETTQQTEPSDANQNSDNSNFSQSSDSTAQQQQQAENASGKIMIPVVGIKREQLRDAFSDARSQGRVHNANDIMAAAGTPVVAATDGEIAKFFDSERGGITIYQYSPDKRMVYYYAHLQKRADNLKEHDYVKQGTIIGYVGDTGNSGTGNYHLHFAVTILDDPKNIFKGTDINPYPLLKGGIEAH
jgi:murein DD-endopeptidase MepM/ murein hydrolase activator NlpD